MKKLLVIFFILLSESTFARSVLPDEYYVIKGQLQTMDSPVEYYWGKPEDREKDFINVKKLVSIINKYPSNNEEVINQKRFIDSAIQMILPLKDYKDSFIGAYDNFEKLSGEKRDYYLILKKWSNEEYIYYLISTGETERNANRIASARWKINYKNTYEQGKKEYLKFFEENDLNPHIIWTFFSYLNNEDRGKEIDDFYKKHFNMMTAKQINHHQIAPMLQYIMTEMKNKGMEKQYVNKLLDKLGGENKNILNFENQPDDGKDYLLDILCDENVLTDKALNLRVKGFIKKNKKILEKRKEKYYLNNKTREFIIKNSKYFGLNSDLENKIKNNGY